VYLHDFSVKHIELDGPESKRKDIVTDYIVNDLWNYEKKGFCKFIGAGVPNELRKIAPKLSSRLWSELDIVPISLRLNQESYSSRGQKSAYWDIKAVDEQADSMARKCIM
jgi:alpha,alpha-trehalose phosphorylase (configuration-retaining)